MATVNMSAPKTPEQKHAAARQSQAMGRFGGVLVLLVFLGIPALVVGLILYGMAHRNRRRYAILLLGMLVGMALVGLSYRTLLAHGQALAAAWQPYGPAVSQYLKAPSQQHWHALSPLVDVVTPHIVQLWLMALPLAACVAVYLESTRIKTLPELRADKERLHQQRDGMKRREAAQQVAQAPEQIQGKPVIGVPLSGELPDWSARQWVVYPAELLNRHALVIGGSGTGKTEFLLRLAYLVAKILRWQVFYIDAKGDYDVANRFMATMAHANVSRVAMFPDLAYNGWKGDATAILNRLMAIEDYSEPYYRAIAKTVLSLACNAPGGPPRSSIDLLDRLSLSALSELYAGSNDRRADTLTTLGEHDLAGVYKRYFGFFDALGRKLDGSWSFETVDAGYILLDGLALKEEARSLGRYLLEDVANYVSKRKKTDRRVLFIVDEWSAIASGGADAANLFERLRSYGAGIIVTSQSYDGLGEGAAKMIGAAWATIAFQCADPEPIAARAGTMREVQTSLRTEYAALPGQNPLLAAKEHMTGTSTEHEMEVPRLHPNVIRKLRIGECCIITNGAYQEIRVARLPKLPDTGVMWGKTGTGAAQTPTQPRKALLLATPGATAGKPALERSPAQAEPEEIDLLLPATRVTGPTTEPDMSDAALPLVEQRGDEQAGSSAAERIAVVAAMRGDESPVDAGTPASIAVGPTTRLIDAGEADELDL